MNGNLLLISNDAARGAADMGVSSSAQVLGCQLQLLTSTCRRLRNRSAGLRPCRVCWQREGYDKDPMPNQREDGESESFETHGVDRGTKRLPSLTARCYGGCKEEDRRRINVLIYATLEGQKRKDL